MRRKHELRDDDGHLIAVIDMIEPTTPIADHGMVELAADIAGRSIRVRIFPRKTAEDIERARRAA